MILEEIAAKLSLILHHFHPSLPFFSFRFFLKEKNLNRYKGGLVTKQNFCKTVKNDCVLYSLGRLKVYPFLNTYLSKRIFYFEKIKKQKKRVHL